MAKGKSDPKKSTGKVVGKGQSGKFVGKGEKGKKDATQSSGIKSSKDCEDDEIKTNSTGAKIKGRKK